METCEYKLQWIDIEDSPSNRQTIHTGISKILQKVVDDGQPEDMIGCSVDHPALDVPITIAYSKQEKMTANKIANLITNAATSSHGILIDNAALSITFTRMRAPIGGRPGQR